MPTMDHPPLACTSCGQPMEKRECSRRDGVRIRIDLCHPCHAIWFDRVESLALSPKSVLDLFRDIHAHGDAERRPLATRQACPRCRAGLVLTHDLARSGWFSYYRCPADHGRMTPYFQFLREKHFVRALTPAELSRVRAEIKQVHCSSCGAPIDLERDDRCGFCAAPVSILDSDAVEKAVRLWAEAEARLQPAGPAAVAQATLDINALESRARRDARRWAHTERGQSSAAGDLLDASIDLLGALFDL